MIYKLYEDGVLLHTGEYKTLGSAMRALSVRSVYQGTVLRVRDDQGEQKAVKNQGVWHVWKDSRFVA